ncbi:unnamed protein product [Effrenium voratum]|uniref:Uncharacterized protein n=1 Tax=Effrenium voratum TaxID=2562239 RepID=A0AA36J4I8_9DINO|nr:unnamed protein product [Effrenium voratum]
MAENWCPVIVESETGNRWVLHVDPLQVRQCRMKLRQELFDVQEKRARMLRRIKALRAELPKADPKELAACWAQELQEAQDRKGEKLLRAFPPSRHITVFLEISSNMVQLELVCRHLREELPKQIEAAGAGLLTLVALDGGGVEPLGFAESRVYVLRKKGVGYGSHLV